MRNIVPKMGAKRHIGYMAKHPIINGKASLLLWPFYYGFLTMSDSFRVFASCGKTKTPDFVWKSGVYC